MEKWAQEFLPGLPLEFQSCLYGDTGSAGSGACLWKPLTHRSVLGLTEEWGRHSPCCPSASEEPGQQGLCLAGSLCRPAGLAAALCFAPSLLPGSWRFPLSSVLFSSDLVPHPNKHPYSVKRGKPGLWGGHQAFYWLQQSLNNPLNKPKVSIL